MFKRLFRFWLSLRIRYASYAFEMVRVAGCKDKVDADDPSHAAHGFGNRLLVIVSVAPEVIDKVEVQ